MKDSIRYNDPRRFWQLRKAGLLAALLGALWVAMPGAAQAGTQEFTVLAVGIDYNSERADELALEYARKRALFLAIRKLGIKEPAKAAAKIKPEDMAQIIRGATVMKSQRQFDKTYLEVKVSIVELPLRRALGLKDTEAVPGSGDPSMRAVLVLPAVVQGKRAFVWGKENVLREPLATELLRQAHGTVMLPGGDLADLRLVDGDNVARVKMEELKPMFERYGADEIIIVLLSPGVVGTSEPDKVILRRMNAFAPRDEILELPEAQMTDDAATRINRVAQTVAQATVEIASATAMTMKQKLDASTKIPVNFVYTIPKELAQITAGIRQTEGVLLLELPSINLNNVTGTIYLDGDKTALRKALAAKGIICREQGDRWIVSVR